MAIRPSPWRSIAIALVLVFALPAPPALALRAGLEGTTHAELAAGLETGPSWDIVRIDPDPVTRLGKLQTVRIAGGRPTALFIVQWITQHQQLAEALGFQWNAPTHELRYPNAEALNARIAALNGASPILSRFVEVPDRASSFVYLRHWARREAVLAPIATPRYHEHDIGVHLPGFLVLPSDIVECSSGQAAFLVQVAESPHLQAASFQQLVQRDIRHRAGLLDSMTVMWPAIVLRGVRVTAAFRVRAAQMVESPRAVGEALLRAVTADPTHLGLSDNDLSNLTAQVEAASDRGADLGQLLGRADPGRSTQPTGMEEPWGYYSYETIEQHASEPGWGPLWAEVQHRTKQGRVLGVTIVPGGIQWYGLFDNGFDRIKVANRITPIPLLTGHLKQTWTGVTIAIVDTKRKEEQLKLQHENRPTIILLADQAVSATVCWRAVWPALHIRAEKVDMWTDGAGNLFLFQMA